MAAVATHGRTARLYFDHMHGHACTPLGSLLCSLPAMGWHAAKLVRYFEPSTALPMAGRPVLEETNTMASSFSCTWNNVFVHVFVGAGLPSHFLRKGG
jgi:hypothetical protein